MSLSFSANEFTSRVAQMPQQERSILFVNAVATKFDINNSAVRSQRKVLCGNHLTTWTRIT